MGIPDKYPPLLLLQGPDASGALPVLLQGISELEEHPAPDRCGGVDYKALYKYLALLMQVLLLLLATSPSLTPPTSRTPTPPTSPISSTATSCFYFLLLLLLLLLLLA